MGLIFKIMRYAIVGVIILALGSEVLTSVSSVVLALRFGNPFPLTIALVLTGLLMLVSGRAERETPLRIVLEICAWTAGVYVVAIVFVATMYLGLIVSLLFAAVTVSVYSTIQSPERLSNIRRLLIGLTSQIELRVSSLTQENPVFGLRVGLRAATTMTSITIPLERTAQVIQLMEMNTSLPISVGRYEESLILIVPRDQSEATKQALALAEIHDYEECTAVLTTVVMQLPVLEEAWGLLMKHYGVIYNQEAIHRLLTSWPLRAIVFPIGRELRMIVRSEDAAGFHIERLPYGLERKILVERKMTLLPARPQGVY